MAKKPKGDKQEWENKIKVQYVKCHQVLVDYLLKQEPKSNGHRGPEEAGEEARKQLAESYEKALERIVRPMLRLIANKLYKDHPKIKIKWSYIQFNSLNVKLNSRVRIPWYGNFDCKLINGNISAQEWVNKQKGWIECNYCEGKRPKDVGNGTEPRALMYLQPDKPTHLLTEILWRLKPTQVTDIGKGDWVGLIKAADAKAHRINTVAGTSWHVLACSKAAEFRKAFPPVLEKWRAKNIDRALVPLDRKYTQDDTNTLLGKALGNWLFAGVSRRSHRNVFYITDVTEAEQLAGIDMELDLPYSTNAAALNEIDALLHKCQWLISQYVIGLISRVEKVHAVAGGLYREMYFQESKKSAKPNYAMLDDLCGFLKPQNYHAVIGATWMKPLLGKLRTHFEVTRGKRGAYCLGYRRHAYEVACTVAGVMDVLFDIEKPKSIENAVRRAGPQMAGIKESLKKAGAPFLFQQLLQGLATEDQLFLTPMYREHFIHSFYVFVLGLILMRNPPNAAIPGSLRMRGKNYIELCELLQNWFLVSMWHDIAYILEKGSGVLEQYVLRFMQDGTRHKGLLPWIPGLGHLMQVKQLLDEVRLLCWSEDHKPTITWNGGETNTNPKKERERIGRLMGDIVVAAAFEYQNHGVWSALMFNHGWCEDMTKLVAKARSSKKTKEKLSLSRRITIARAIIPHHIADWKTEELLKDMLDTNDPVDKAVLADSKKNSRPFIISRDDNPLGYLLGLCDMLCQAGREAPELAGGVPSNLKIKYKSLRRDGSSGLRIDLSYIRGEQTMENLKKFYIEPACFLGLAQADHKNSMVVSIGQLRVALGMPSS